MTVDTSVELPDVETHGHAGRMGLTPAGLAARGGFLLVVLAAVVLLPRSEDLATQGAKAAIYAMVGLSLNILIGYTGQLSLGHQGFVGVGAFAAAYSATQKGVPFSLSIVLAAVFGALFALLLGMVALRITGLYLALITLVFGLTLEASLFQVNELTQGGAGQLAERPDYVISFYRYYLLCLGVLAVIVYVDWRLTRTKTGRALLALKENERVAAAFGINVTAFKLLAFVLSGAIAGIAGALFAYLTGLANGSDYDFFLALTFVLMTVVGGLTSRAGVIIASAFFAVLDYLLENVGFLHNFLVDGAGPIPGFGEQRIQFAPRLVGALLLLSTLIFYPGGLGQQIRPITRWLAGGKFTMHDDADSGPGAVEGSSARA